MLLSKRKWDGREKSCSGKSEIFGVGKDVAELAGVCPHSRGEFCSPRVELWVHGPSLNNQPLGLHQEMIVMKSG